MAKHYCRCGQEIKYNVLSECCAKCARFLEIKGKAMKKNPSRVLAEDRGAL
jgi:hypothetical protein